mgnify:CR=1 FL=1
MDCPKCGGLMLGRDERCDLGTLWYYGCLNCGNVIDEQILRNRAQAEPGPERRHPTMIMPCTVEVTE